MFQRNVRFHVDITCATPPADNNSTNGSLDKSSDKPTIYCITFTLISGKNYFEINSWIGFSKLFWLQVRCVDSNASVITFSHKYWAEEEIPNTRLEWVDDRQESWVTPVLVVRVVLTASLQRPHGYMSLKIQWVWRPLWSTRAQLIWRLPYPGVSQIRTRPKISSKDRTKLFRSADRKAHDLSII